LNEKSDSGKIKGTNEHINKPTDGEIHATMKPVPSYKVLIKAADGSSSERKMPILRFCAGSDFRPDVIEADDGEAPVDNSAFIAKLHEELAAVAAGHADEIQAETEYRDALAEQQFREMAARSKEQFAEQLAELEDRLARRERGER
jgi:hypothetical protein